MSYDDEEVLIDDEVRQALDERLLAWDGASSGRMLGGVSYSVGESVFAVLLEGMVAARVGPSIRSQALTLAGVSPFRPPSDDAGDFEDWVQLVLLLPEDADDVVPLLDAAYRHALSSDSG